MTQLADLLVRPAPELPPTKPLLLHIPTPTQELAPALPTPKLKLFTGSRSSLPQSPCTLELTLICSTVSQPGTPAAPALVEPSWPLPSPTIKLNLSRPPSGPPADAAVKKKKEKSSKPVAKAQSSGMSDRDLLGCRSMLKKLVRFPSLALMPTRPLNIFRSAGYE